jgi:hypothetical protein
MQRNLLPNRYQNNILSAKINLHQVAIFFPKTLASGIKIVVSSDESQGLL